MKKISNLNRRSSKPETDIDLFIDFTLTFVFEELIPHYAISQVDAAGTIITKSKLFE